MSSDDKQKNITDWGYSQMTCSRMPETIRKEKNREG
jgi:hypothetical protein